MPRRLEQLQYLEPWERRMLARLALLLPGVGVALRLLGFKRTRDLLERLVPAQPVSNCSSSVQKSETAHRIACLVSIAGNHGPYRATCLRQALALSWLLRRRCIPAELRIGVRKDGGNFQAHAWVEHERQALNDTHGATSSYAAFSPSHRGSAVSPP